MRALRSHGVKIKYDHKHIYSNSLGGLWKGCHWFWWDLDVILSFECFHSRHFGSLTVRKNAAHIIIRRNQKGTVLLKIKAGKSFRKKMCYLQISPPLLVLNTSSRASLNGKRVFSTAGRSKQRFCESGGCYFCPSTSGTLFNIEILGDSWMTAITNQLIQFLKWRE